MQRKVDPRIKVIESAQRKIDRIYRDEVENSREAIRIAAVLSRKRKVKNKKITSNQRASWKRIKREYEYGMYDKDLFYRRVKDILKQMKRELKDESKPRNSKSKK